MRPVFADPKTDFVFKRLFGTEEHKPLLIALLNALLELDSEHLIEDVELLDASQRPPLAELKHSIVDVKCRDRQGAIYVVEMQVLNVEGFDKRVMYNVAKAYTAQLAAGSTYPSLNDVIGVSICNFLMWPEGEVPMLSRWRMQEQHSGTLGLSQLQLVFLELPKYAAGDRPERPIDKWAYFFREAPTLAVIPEVLAQPPLRDALEAARAAGMSEEEWDAYIRDGMAIQDQRGALSLAHRQGHQQGHQQGKAEGLKEGKAQGLVEAIESLCDVLAIAMTQEQRQMLRRLDIPKLEALLGVLRRERRWPEDAGS